MERTRLRAAASRAFTLIELLVVILILGILLGIALPTLLNQQNKGKNSATEVQLTTAYHEAAALYTSESAWPTLCASVSGSGTSSTCNDTPSSAASASLIAQLSASEPGMTFVPGPNAATTSAVDVTGDGSGGAMTANGGVTFCEQSQSSVYFCLKYQQSGGLTVLADYDPSPLDRVTGTGVAEAATTGTVERSNGPTEAAAVAALSSTGGSGTPGWSTIGTGSGTTVVATIPVSNAVAPAVSGSATMGSTLTASSGTWSGAPSSYAYQWQDCNATASTCTAATGTGASSASYTVATADQGAYLRVRVTATGATGSATAVSALSAAVTSASANWVSAINSNPSSGNITPAYFYSLTNASGAGTLTSGGSAGGSATPHNVSFGQSSAALPGQTSASFDGSSAYIDLGTSSALTPSTVSVELWVKTTQTGYAVLLRDRNYGYGLSLSGGNPSFSIFTSASNNAVVTAGTDNIADGTWHYLVATYDGSTLKLYDDGALVASTPIAGSLYYAGSQDAGIGDDADALSSYFAGNLNDVSVYDGALAAPDICAHYQVAVPNASCSTH